MELFKLMGTIAVNNSEANANIEETSGKAESFGSKLASGIGTVGKWSAAIVGGTTAAVGGMVKFAESSAATCDNVDKMSQKIGISREAYQELDFICSQSGTSVDTLQAGLKTMTKCMDTTAKGTSKSATALEELGIAATDSNGKLRNQEEVMWEALETLQGMDDQTKKAALSSKLFGKAGLELMPLLNGASGSIEEMKNQAHDLGLVLSDDVIDNGVNLTDSLDQTKRAFSSIVTQLGGALMPMVEKASDYIQKSLPRIQKFIQRLEPIITQMFDSLLPPLMNLCEQIFPILMDLIESLLPPVTEIVQAILPIIVELVQLLLPPLVQIIQMVLPILVELITTLLPLLQPLMDLLTPLIVMLTTLLQPLMDLINMILPPIINLLVEITNSIIGLLKPAIDVISNVITTILLVVIKKIQTVVTAMWTVVKPIWTEMKTVISTVINSIKEKITTVWEAIKTVTVTVFNAIKTTISTVFEAIKTVVTTIVNTIQTVVTTVWEAIKTVSSTVWNAIKTVVETPINAIKTTVSTVFSTIKTTITTVWNTIKTTTTTVWNAIKTAITTPIETAKDTIEGIVDKIKGFFDFDFELPDIKLPHFSIKPSGWSIGDLLDGEIPSLGIEWYAKGGVMDGVTPFGLNGNRLMIGGEAGKEAIIPLEKNTKGLDLISEKISDRIGFNDNTVIQEKMNKMIEILEKLLGMKIYLDNEVMVGQLAPAMDVALGSIYDAKGRGGRSTW